MLLWCFPSFFFLTRRVLFNQWHFGGFLQTSELWKTTACFSSHKTMASWEEVIHFLTLKTRLNHCCQAGDTKGGAESSSGSLCVPWVIEAKHLPASLPGSGSHGNSLRSPAALTYPSVAGKIAIIHVKQRPFILWFPLSLPAHTRFLWITSSAPLLKKLSWLWGGRERNEFFFLPVLLLLLWRVLFVQLLWVMNTLLRILRLLRSV